jgi:hypothetical protein
MDGDEGIIQIIPDGDTIRLVATGRTGLASSLSACLTHFKMIGERRDLWPEFHGSLTLEHQSGIVLLASDMHRQDMQCGPLLPRKW